MDLSTAFKYIIWALVALISLIYTFVQLFKHSPRPGRESEKFYITNTKSGQISQPKPLPSSITSDAQDGIEISLVIPCYNETSRLPVMLTEAIPVLNRVAGHSKWEIVLVDDGSSDDTSTMAVEWAISQNIDPGVLRVCILAENRGKGGSVTHGMKHTRGKYAIFADADGASKFDDIQKLLDVVNEAATVKKVSSSKDPLPPIVAIGSRAHMVKTDAVVKRSFIRNFLMYGLHTLVFVFGIRSIGDTQCGFKLFTRSAVQKIFPYLHTERWIFDVEVLIIAGRKDIPIYEVPISWHEVEGSKIELAKDSILMAKDLVVMRLAYLMGIYDDSAPLYQ